MRLGWVELIFTMRIEIECLNLTNIEMNMKILNL